MKLSYRWTHPLPGFVGDYPNWAGYSFLQWSDMSKNWHEGADYNGPGGCDADTGMDLVACAEGTVEWFGYHNGWGYHLFIRHEDPEEGTIYSHYAHCKKDSFTVKIGQEVSVGEKIAEVGDSGWNSMCAHLHFEIRKPLSQGYDFWPSPSQGWNKEKMLEYYYDPYYFIQERLDREPPKLDLCEDIRKELSEQTKEKEKYKVEARSLRSKEVSLSNKVLTLEEEVADLTERYQRCVAGNGQFTDDYDSILKKYNEAAQEIKNLTAELTEYKNIKKESEVITMLENIKNIDGKKTYIMAALGGVTVVLFFLNVIDAETANMFLGLLGFGGLAALRHGVGKK